MIHRELVGVRSARCKRGTFSRLIEQRRDGPCQRWLARGTRASAPAPCCPRPPSLMAEQVPRPGGSTQRPSSGESPRYATALTNGGPSLNRFERGQLSLEVPAGPPTAVDVGRREVRSGPARLQHRPALPQRFSAAATRSRWLSRPASCAAVCGLLHPEPGRRRAPRTRPFAGGWRPPMAPAPATRPVAIAVLEDSFRADHDGRRLGADQAPRLAAPHMKLADRRRRRRL